MTSVDQLVSIPTAEWPELRDLYKCKWPQHILPYCTVDNFVRWVAKDQKIKDLAIYSLNGSWKDNGTYVIIFQNQLFTYTLNTTNEFLLRILHLIDFKRGYQVNAYLKRHREPILRVLDIKKAHVEYEVGRYLYYFPKNKADKLELNLPSGFSLKSLTSRNIDHINRTWPKNNEMSAESMKRLASLNVNVGLFNRNDDLVAWILRLQTGPLGAIQVHPNYLHKGYGSLVVKAMIKKLANKDIDAFALVACDNTATQERFKNLGFKRIDKAFKLKIVPES